MSDSPSRSRGAGIRLGPRYKWMMSCVATTFNIDELVVEQEFRNPETYDRIAATFEVGGPRRLIVSMQASSSSSDIDTKKEGDLPPTIVVSDGGSVSMAGSKVCYFVKTANVAINTDVSSDQYMIFGELSKNMLTSVSTSLGKLYQPVFEAKTSWGQAEEAQTQEFSGVMNNFLSDLTDSMRAITKGVDLKKPDTNKYNLDERPLTNGTLAYGVKILASWCNTIDGILEQDTSANANGSSSGSSNQQEAGPMTELDFWKRYESFCGGLDWCMLCSCCAKRRAHCVCLGSPWFFSLLFLLCICADVNKSCCPLLNS